ncbi:MAG: hypothetical protein UU65_C0001G0194 [candidate division CPR2 bacterium GW2011_GWC1_41_48]|uniref:Uncharacterized protein n=1 Tax=candidate division CPR2 bacterium GW2011_GWC1_41_48 TaxID=1618344 RepID=A0A0G0W9V6_UNCC2|nr:MAG: hypothetical protein UT47_C0001G0194 [candidate division CPR2 bacterium GW2011_GWC2_39_35]KKS09789.1 MAG: hypothetical protein UU65_C0001G0194 [candidate division CPR2 bacterium GW2011_GWC1_41_48]
MIGYILVAIVAFVLLAAAVYRLWLQLTERTWEVTLLDWESGYSYGLNPAHLTISRRKRLTEAKAIKLKEKLQKKYPTPRYEIRLRSSS